MITPTTDSSTSPVSLAAPIEPCEPLTAARIAAAWKKISQALLDERVPHVSASSESMSRESNSVQGNSGDHHWVGQLSTSALSTATAVSALALVRKHRTSLYQKRSVEIDQAIAVACQWLMRQQNEDGGFGDTDKSHSNIATTLLVLAAWQLGDRQVVDDAAVKRAWQYCDRIGKWDALRKRYGKDKTFVAPILTNCALAGIVSWDEVPTLPYEAAWLPQSWYRLARMPVVSYAVPALVAIGQAKFHHRPPRGPLRALRAAAIEPTLRVLDRMQPASGGYLEAAPLTSFVLMCLADTGRGDHPVAERAVEFLLNSRLADGSLPIDTNLATWTTSLSIAALEQQPHSDVHVKTIRWLLSCQHWAPHPFTGARPGGWGWSDLSGAVPDADDTPAALIALARWSEHHRDRYPILQRHIEIAVDQGLRWLVDLQNRDGGWPTFCRGWGKLPFDRSGSDLTAHAIRAIDMWIGRYKSGTMRFDKVTVKQLQRATQRGFRFLENHARADGSWFPLWFGNQDRVDEENPIYGTSKVLLAYAQCQRSSAARDRGVEYLVRHQNADGGWGGGKSVGYRVLSQPVSEVGSSLEETGAALEALLGCGGSGKHLKPTIMRALRWMVCVVEQDCFRDSWPIGFYFAKLWYHERLYPILAATAALGAAMRGPIVEIETLSSSYGSSP